MAVQIVKETISFSQNLLAFLVLVLTTVGVVPALQGEGLSSVGFPSGKCKLQINESRVI
jgi:hypothetical protein